MSFLRESRSLVSPPLHSHTSETCCKAQDTDCVLGLNQVADYEFGVALSGDLQGVTLGHNS
jgi:hypothetical protein